MERDARGNGQIMIRYIKTKIIGLFFDISMDQKCIRFFHCDGCYTNRPRTCENTKCSLCEKRREYKRKKPIPVASVAVSVATDGTNREL